MKRAKHICRICGKDMGAPMLSRAHAECYRVELMDNRRVGALLDYVVLWVARLDRGPSDPLVRVLPGSLSHQEALDRIADEFEGDSDGWVLDLFVDKHRDLSAYVTDPHLPAGKAVRSSSALDKRTCACEWGRTYGGGARMCPSCGRPRR